MGVILIWLVIFVMCIISNQEKKKRQRNLIAYYNYKSEFIAKNGPDVRCPDFREWAFANGITPPNPNQKVMWPW